MSGACVDCGTQIDPSAKRCRSCYRILQRRWTRQDSIVAFQRWAAEHGEPPSAGDWTRNAGGYWPSLATATALFGSWSALSLAAGFTGDKRRSSLTAKMLERFDRTGSDCWQWNGTITPGGYGVFAYADERGGQKCLVSAHRWSYEYFVEPIPEGLTIDHLCKNRRCVNPAHLEPVTAGENSLRGDGPAAQNARKTHCKRGHALSGDNLVIKSGTRQCRECRARRQQLRRVTDIAASSLDDPGDDAA